MDHVGRLKTYQRHENAQRDKSWSAHGIDSDGLIQKVCDYDRHVGACLRLMRTMGLRRKEAVQFRPFEHVVSFPATGIALEAKQADRYVRTKGKGGRVRYIPVDSPSRQAAVDFALGIVRNQDDHISDPSKELKQNLRRFRYAMEKFGITHRGLGATGHGLRHEVMNDTFEAITGEASPVRGGGPLPVAIDRDARKQIAQLAGHARTRAAGAYCGPSVVMREKTAGRKSLHASADQPGGNSLPQPHDADGK